MPRPRLAGGRAALLLVFSVSGAAGLVFETLWFRQAGLAFGSSVTASSLVLASFMAGLALGGAAVARFGASLRRPLRVFAALELAIGATGVALVWALPVLGARLAPWLHPLLGEAWLLHPLRLAVSGALLLVPATAMGASLPVLVTALAGAAGFGPALGRLYAWNTLGAVAGALLGESLLVERLGVRGASYAAAGLNALAAAGALGLAGAGGWGVAAPPRPAAHAPPGSAAAVRRLLAGSFLAGAILLALEVVWFRFLHLFVVSSADLFAAALAVVLAGIGAGSALAGAWLRRDPGAHRHLAALALLTGTVAIALYPLFAVALAPFEAEPVLRRGPTMWLTAALAGPVALLSGLLFPLTGAALHARDPSDTRAAGWLAFANTLGAGAGALVAGFWLLPGLGMERCLFALPALYAAVAALWRPIRPAGAGARAGTPGTPGDTAADTQRARRARLAASGLLAVALLAFPFGAMDHYLRVPARRYGHPESGPLVAVREGRDATVAYLRLELDGEPLYHRLLTGSFSMAQGHDFARRYMKLFAWWPAALHPELRSALLISYGMGITARALADTPSLERIDVVDTSERVLELAHVPFPDPARNPLRDPRVRVHVEDGRYFLQTVPRRYDLITGEPPPPKNEGVENLYTREYFALLRERLAPGGLTTYWLPVHLLTPIDVARIAGGFCEVFPDCTLWTAAGSSWMLVGSRDARGRVSEAHFARQWRDPRVGAELRALAIEHPEQLGALFLADRGQIARLVESAPPLSDDFPRRLDPPAPFDPLGPSYLRAMDPRGARERFAKSRFVRERWPTSLRERSAPYFDHQRLLNRAMNAARPAPPARRVRELHRVLQETGLRTLVLWHLGTTVQELGAVDRLLARGASDEPYLEPLAARALADRDYPQAARLYARAAARDPGSSPLAELHAYATCRSQRPPTPDTCLPPTAERGRSS